VIIEIDPVEPEPWLLARAATALRNGGVVVMPTDTVYAITCGIEHADAIKRIYALKDMDSKKPLSILVSDMATVGRYARGVSTPVYRMMKRVLPGAYTFIFPAAPDVPKIMLHKRKTIGIRIPDHAIPLALLAEIDGPLLSTSIRNPNDDFINDPNEIEDRLGTRLDVVIDGGILAPTPSTVIDFSTDPPELIRQGKGDIDALELFA
jgi:tRNA threonylcarbamoyl adenosine modification protein (Sua5/YciO/YrdC/YwlC family)